MPWTSLSQPTHPGHSGSAMLTSSRLAESFVPYSKQPTAFHLPTESFHTTTFPARLPGGTFPSSCTLSRNHSVKPDVCPHKAYHFESRSSNVSIPHLREALHCLDSKMASLMTQRQELESHLEQAVRLQSPVLRLPSELLASIFVIGVQEMEEEDSLLVSTLMLVCRYWAEVAVGTPVLWSKIEVSKHHSFEKARRKLARSKSVPLDITINFGPRPEHTIGVTENVIHAMDLFRPALWRTRSFRLSVPNRPQAHAALLRCQEDAPLLEFLSIRIFHSIEEDHHSRNPPLPLFNGHTPRLRSCSFTSFNFGWDLGTLSRLSVLKLGGYFNGFSPSVDTLLDILHECPLLEEFALRDMSDVDMDLCPSQEVEIQATRVIRLPRLVKASFYCAGIVRSRMILEQLFFPALESLEFCYLNNVTPILQRLEIQSLTSLPLRYLRIESCLFNELTLVRLLRRLPSLFTLELVDNEDVSSNFLRVSSFRTSIYCYVNEHLTGPLYTSFDATMGLPQTWESEFGWMHIS
jgi:hypothetical protein